LAGFSVDIEDLTGLGALLLQSKNPVERLLGRDILLSASRAGSHSATIFLVNAARKQNTLTTKELIKPQAQLKQIVKSGSASVQALVLQGMLYHQQRAYTLAASLFEQAIAMPQKSTKEHLSTRIGRFIGLDLENQDPNLDPRRPEELELDVVQAYVQLSGLQYGNHIPSKKDEALENMKVAALKYDDPVAYYQLAETVEKYSLKWLEYTRKAAASGYSVAMEDIGAIYAMKEEELKTTITDERVLDWVLNNPLFSVPMPTGIKSTISNKEKLRTVQRYTWAKEWYIAAGRRAITAMEAARHVAMIEWNIADLHQSMGHELWNVRLWRICARERLRFAVLSKGGDVDTKYKGEVVLKDTLKEPMGRETAELHSFWRSQKIPHCNDQKWLESFLKTIDEVPAGTWKKEEKKR
jgi:hypothetical protein